MNKKGEVVMATLGLIVFVSVCAGAALSKGASVLAVKSVRAKAIIAAATNQCGGDNPSADCMIRTDDVLTVSARSGNIR